MATRRRKTKRKSNKYRKSKGKKGTRRRKSRKRKHRISEVSDNVKNKIKRLRIEYYSATNCGYCVETNYMLKKAGVMNYIKKYTNKLSPDGGVPYFYSKTTRKSHLGYPGSVNNLIKKLS
jgi:hypothetical protein